MDVQARAERRIYEKLVESHAQAFTTYCRCLPSSLNMERAILNAEYALLLAKQAMEGLDDEAFHKEAVFEKYRHDMFDGVRPGNTCFESVELALTPEEEEQLRKIITPEKDDKND